jgi:hypothetical protein
LIRGLDLNDIEAWLKDFLVEFRRQYDQLSEDQKSRISNLDNFMPPCQMDIFCFKGVSFQWLIVTHGKERKDAEIACHGPVPTYQAVETLESVLSDSKWDRELSEEEKKTFFFVTEKRPKFRDLLEPVLLKIVGELRNLPLIGPGPTMIGRKQMLSLDSFVWYVRGSVTDLPCTEAVTGIMEDAKKQAEIIKAKGEQAQPEPRKSGIKGFGTYFYPPVWVGKLPEQTFREKAFGSILFPMKALDTNYKGRIIVINEDGFIAIGEQDSLKATKMLNEIMATAFLHGLQFLSARELEVSDAEIDPSTLNLTSFGVRGTSLRAQLFPMNQFSTRIFRIEIEKETLVDLIREAERINQDPDLADFLVLLLEAHTCMQSSEYMQSFMMSWMIVEKNVFWMWNRFLKEEMITGDRRRKLTNPMSWTVDSILETLNLAGKLSSDDYITLIALKNKRNRIMHESERVTPEEAERCFNVAKVIVQQRCSGLSDRGMKSS